jgi:hypothetical protein
MFSTVFSKPIQIALTELDALMVKRNKLVTILNKMKRSDHTYWESTSMDYPIYSIPNAEKCLKYAKQHFENYVNKQYQHEKSVNVKQLIKNSEVDKWSELLSKVSQAKNHLEYCQNKYKNYKWQLRKVNLDITALQINLYQMIKSDNNIPVKSDNNIPDKYVENDPTNFDVSKMPNNLPSHFAE